MACARKCDICGKYYDVLEVNPGDLEPWSNTSMVRILKLDYKNDHRLHDVIHFDVCDECLGDMMDFILSKQADSTAKEET